MLWCESWEYSGSESLVQYPDTSVSDSEMFADGRE